MKNEKELHEVLINNLDNNGLATVAAIAAVAIALLIRIDVLETQLEKLKERIESDSE